VKNRRLSDAVDATHRRVKNDLLPDAIGSSIVTLILTGIVAIASFGGALIIACAGVMVILAVIIRAMIVLPNQSETSRIVEVLRKGEATGSISTGEPMHASTPGPEPLREEDPPIPGH